MARMQCTIGSEYVHLQFILRQDRFRSSNGVVGELSKLLDNVNDKEEDLNIIVRFAPRPLVAVITLYRKKKKGAQSHPRRDRNCSHATRTSQLKETSGSYPDGSWCGGKIVASFPGDPQYTKGKTKGKCLWSIRPKFHIHVSDRGSKAGEEGNHARSKAPETSFQVHIDVQ